MATKAFERIKTPHDGRIVLYRWENITEDDDGEPVVVPTRADKTVQVVGDFGTSGEITVEGSLIPSDFVTPVYGTLNDPQANSLTITAAKVEAILENTYLVRPRATAGSDVDVDIYLLVKKD